MGMNCFRGPETMLPWLRLARRCGAERALPIPYRTPLRNDISSTSQTTAPGSLAPRSYLPDRAANRYEIGAFEEVHDLGINYLGVCCGASPMLVHEVAEAVGKSTEASRSREHAQPLHVRRQPAAARTHRGAGRRGLAAGNSRSRPPAAAHPASRRSVQVGGVAVNLTTCRLPTYYPVDMELRTQTTHARRAHRRTTATP